MADLSLGSGLSGVAQAPQSNYSNAGMASVTAAAFGPGVTVEAPGKNAGLNPKHPVGLSIWVGTVAVILLYSIRRSLPN